MRPSLRDEFDLIIRLKPNNFDNKPQYIFAWKLTTTEFLFFDTSLINKIIAKKNLNLLLKFPKIKFKLTNFMFLSKLFLYF